MAYHLYYGHAGVWWLAPWALATAIVYWRWPDVRLLVALMVLDVVWNAQGVLFGDDLLTDLVLLGVGLALLAVAFAIDLRWYRNPTPPMTPTTSLRTVWLRAHGTSPELAGASAETLRRDPLAAAHLWWGALATRDRHPRALADLTVDPSCWDFDAVEQELSELSPAHELVPTDTLDGTARGRPRPVGGRPRALDRASADPGARCGPELARSSDRTGLRRDRPGLRPGRRLTPDRRPLSRCRQRQCSSSVLGGVSPCPGRSSRRPRPNRAPPVARRWTPPRLPARHRLPIHRRTRHRRLPLAACP